MQQTIAQSTTYALVVKQAQRSRRFAPLVREGSVFWNTSGVSAQATLLKGLEFELESIRSLVQGGVEFATPSAKAPRAKQGGVFFLHEGPRDEWLNWEPHIPLPAEKN